MNESATNMKTVHAWSFVLGAIFVLCSGSADARGTPPAPCQDQTAFSNITLTVVTTVKPSYNMTWKFSEAPSVVAKYLLTDLNSNTHGIIFTEASGVVPNLLFNMTMSETNEGTQQDSAYITVTGLGKNGNLFTESSGAASFVGWRPAVDKLASNMLVWLGQGWHTNPPCRLPDGTTRTHWP